MTIYCYEGLPGSGKSYDASRKILSQLILGRRIITNIDGMQLKNCQEAIKHLIDIDDYELWDKLIHINNDQVINIKSTGKGRDKEYYIHDAFWLHACPGDLIVIDEAQNFFNSRDWQAVGNREFGKWASEHRKRGNDLILITQAMEGIESSVRRLVEWCYRYKKLNMLGLFGKNKYMRFALYGQSMEPLGKKKCTYDPRIFNCYSSYFEEEIKEKGAETPPNIFRHPIFFIIPVLLVVFLYVFKDSSIATGDLFGTEAAMESGMDNLGIEGITNADKKKVSTSNAHTIAGVINGQRIYQLDNGSIIIQ